MDTICLRFQAAILDLEYPVSTGPFSRNSMDGGKQFKGWFTQDGWKKRSNGVLKCGCLFLWCGEYNQESEWRCHQFSSVSFLGSLD